jgi:hypothetical protein
VARVTCHCDVVTIELCTEPHGKAGFSGFEEGGSEGTNSSRSAKRAPSADRGTLAQYFISTVDVRHKDRQKLYPDDGILTTN